MSHGIACGWLSPYLTTLRSDETPLISGPLTIEQLSWIGALLPCGGMFGCFIFFFIANKFGRKIALLSIAIPQIAGWILKYFCTMYYHLYIARLLIGLAGGGMLILCPLFFSEMLEPR